MDYERKIPRTYEVQVNFNSGLFDPKTRRELNRYFTRTQNAIKTSVRLGLTRNEFNNLLAGIFAEGNSSIVIKGEGI